MAWACPNIDLFGKYMALAGIMHIQVSPGVESLSNRNAHGSLDDGAGWRSGEIAKSGSWYNAEFLHASIELYTIGRDLQIHLYAVPH